LAQKILTLENKQSTKTDSTQNEQLSIIVDMAFACEDKFLLTGGGCKVVVRRAFDLEIVHSYQDTSDNICSLKLAEDERTLFASLVNGQVVIYYKADGSHLIPLPV